MKKLVYYFMKYEIFGHFRPKFYWMAVGLATALEIFGYSQEDISRMQLAVEKWMSTNCPGDNDCIPQCEKCLKWAEKEAARWK